MKIRLSMATYNRRDVLEKCIYSLSMVDNLDEIEVAIYDDNSSEYDIDFLKSLIPFASKVVRNDENYRADKNMYSMYKDFLDSDADFLLQCDSDMLFHKDLINAARQLCEKNQDAIYSFYNSNNHHFIPDKPIINIGGRAYQEKYDIGGASALFSKKIIKNIIDNIIITNNDYTFFDWRWSQYISNQNIPVLVPKHSLMQHIGYVGQNNYENSFIDIGYNFCPTNEEDKNFLVEYYEMIMHNALYDFRALHEKYHSNMHIYKKFIPQSIQNIAKLLIKK